MSNDELPTTCVLHAQKLDRLVADMSAVRTALLGDDFGNHGFKQRIDLAEKEIREIRNAMVKLDVRVSIIAVGISVGAFVLKHLLWS